MAAKQTQTLKHRGRRTSARPPRKATTYRLNPHLQQGLALLGKVRQVSANQMVNEAVGEYLDARTAAVTADLEETLRRVTAYRETDPNFELAIAKFAESEARHGAKDPVEGTQTIEEAVPLLQKVKFTKFDETVEMAVRLGVDPKHSDQFVRGTIVLPHGLGKAKKVVVIANAEKQLEAKEAGADEIGGEELVEKINAGWTDFDAVVATPDMMGAVGKLSKVLGPRGLMPNPKAGTVTLDIIRAVQKIKMGEVEFRVDKAGIVHAPVGKISFASASLVADAHALLDSMVKAKPAAKGKHLKSVTVTFTTGPDVRDPMEGTPGTEANPAQRIVRQLIRG